MHVAELSLCKELYELSGWGDTSEFYVNGMLQHGIDTAFEDHAIKTNYPGYSPAYDLGYLLRKLPAYLEGYQLIVAVAWGIGDASTWQAGYYKPGRKIGLHIITDTTPEDAACKLAIELIKQGVLNHD